MNQGNVLARGARVAGGIICAVLVAVEIIWITRDVKNVGAKDMLLTWIGRLFSGQEHAPLGTSVTDLILLVICLGALVAASKPSASGAFVTVGVITFVYRLPLLWVMTEDSTRGLPLRDRALYTGIGSVVASVALIVIAAAGRRPALSPGEPALSPGEGGGEPAAPPRTVPAVFAGLLLVFLTLVTVAWELYYIHRFTPDRVGPFSYWRQLSGQQPTGTLLSPSGFWADWAVGALGLATAVLAFARKPVARPMGMAMGWILAAYAVFILDIYSKQKVLFTFGDLPTSDMLQQLTAVVEIVAGLLILLLLALRGVHRPTVAAPWAAPSGQYGAWGTPPAPSPYGEAPYGHSPFGNPPDVPGDLPPEFPPNTPPRPQSPPGAGW
ncbi:hypothetical protein QMK19_28105 [Streptomyces sp. H10-C2]|uniref:hypothetical protein n=1 Tax=unclassified Streptomyces TaxID=2593676 RepID=UPI0024B8EB4A|nr:MULTISPECIES: hypothetical protein [unclassified Streptomyces]MDJ0343822.1 hypothetical protein [Streptomyces sp. PH10-H1]MDJ0373411.1 hypothetical protein [Streptomyces sp. H10-C2]